MPNRSPRRTPLACRNDAARDTRLTNCAQLSLFRAQIMAGRSAYSRTVLASIDVRVNIAYYPVQRPNSQINRLSAMLMMIDVMTGMKIWTFPRSITISPGNRPSPSFSANNQATPIATRIIPVAMSVFAISFSMQRT